MIEIDGSFGEGGGQIVRTAVALSAVTGKPVRIIRIRQGRSKPGLAAQHARAITALAAICDAKTSGATPGSSEIVFTPGEIRGGRHRVEIGTAGSVTLLMQCLLRRCCGPMGLLLCIFWEARMYNGLRRLTILKMSFWPLCPLSGPG
jgi:RNA 3'-terminal phosphate cyclase (ATP)